MTAGWSEALLERPQIDFMSPRRARLPMQLPIGFGDRLDAEQAVLAALFDDARQTRAQSVAVDAAVNHPVRDMQSVRPILPCHALRDRAQSGFGGGEMRKARLAAQARRSAGEDQCAAPQRHEAARRLASD